MMTLAQIDFLQLIGCHLRDLGIDSGDSEKARIVRDHRHTVEGCVHVGLEVDRASTNRSVERRERILRHVDCESAMCQNPRSGRREPLASVSSSVSSGHGCRMPARFP